MAPLSPENAQFAIVSFEGPDEYARAGGLAVRVRDLAETLAGAGFHTHLFFIGDPTLPGVEEHGNLTLHRWSQWISAHHPGGVYEGESGKVNDLSASLPPFLISNVIRPAAAAGKVTVVMGEDWQTANAMIGLHHLAAQYGLLSNLIPIWTANNLYGFHGIHWPSLTDSATVMTVSRYMKHQMWPYGVNALVALNGIAPSALVTVPAAETKTLRAAFGPCVPFFKIGRFTPDKRWVPAVRAIALLNNIGTQARILLRGDKSPHGQDVLATAWTHGLRVEDMTERYSTVEDLAAAIRARPNAHVLHLRSFLPDSLLPPIYAAVDGVLANSGHEPFGLVGLEVMGAGGLAYVGSTGEEYAQPHGNAIVLDTDDPLEIVAHARQLQRDRREVTRLKKNGKKTAAAFVWPEVLKDLLAKLEYVALTRGVEVPG